MGFLQRRVFLDVAHEHFITPPMAFGDSNTESFQHVHPLAPYLGSFKEMTKNMSVMLIYLLMNLLKSCSHKSYVIIVSKLLTLRT